MRSFTDFPLRSSESSAIWLWEFCRSAELISLMLAGALGGLAFSLYLAHIENHVLGVWCVYCAISLGTISLITLLLVIAVLAQTFRKLPPKNPQGGSDRVLDNDALQQRRNDETSRRSRRFVFRRFECTGTGTVQPKIVRTTGTAELKVTPDLAVIQLGVEHQSATAKNAKTTVTATSRKILAALKTLGIDNKDIQTDYLSLQPMIDYRKGIAHYQFTAEQSLSVKVRDLSKLDDVMDTVISAGANNIGGIEYQSSELRKYKDRSTRCSRPSRTSKRPMPWQKR